jgi:hypothetical protein
MTRETVASESTRTLRLGIGAQLVPLKGAQELVQFEALLERQRGVGVRDEIARQQLRG